MKKNYPKPNIEYQTLHLEILNLKTITAILTSFIDRLKEQFSFKPRNDISPSKSPTLH